MSDRPDDRRAFTLERVSGRELANHLGVHANRIPAIVRTFGLKRRGGRFQIADIFRRIHRIEPIRLQSCLANLKAAHTATDAGGDAICLVGELVGIGDLARAIWEAGLCPVTDLAPEYGLSRDHFRKMLKAGRVDLPPVAPISLSPRKQMFRPIDVQLWCRHGIAIDWPSPLDAPDATGGASAKERARGEDVFEAIMGETIARHHAQENRISAPRDTLTGDRTR